MTKTQAFTALKAKRCLALLNGGMSRSDIQKEMKIHRNTLHRYLLMVDLSDKTVPTETGGSVALPARRGEPGRVAVKRGRAGRVADTSEERAPAGREICRDVETKQFTSGPPCPANSVQQTLPQLRKKGKFAKKTKKKQDASSTGSVSRSRSPSPDDPQAAAQSKIVKQEIQRRLEAMSPKRRARMEGAMIENIDI